MKTTRNKMEHRQLRERQANFKTREINGALHLSGYFAVFDSKYEISPRMSESIAPGAFTATLHDDIRALTNHNTTLVLGRTTAGTLTLKEDGHGLLGDILINKNDTDAMNTYERVKRGDVSQCSIGFTIEEESEDRRADGSVHWTIKKIRLLEVSVCTFPAYESTGVSARKKAPRRERRLSIAPWKWKTEMLRKLRKGR